MRRIQKSTILRAFSDFGIDRGIRADAGTGWYKVGRESLADWSNGLYAGPVQNEADPRLRTGTGTWDFFSIIENRGVFQGIFPRDGLEA